MALLPDNFIEPSGELSLADFPDYSEAKLETSIQVWLEEAEGKTSNESAQRHWVYHRAYTHIANRFMRGLMSERVGDLQAARSDGQNKYWTKRARYHLQAFNSATGKVPAPILQPWKVTS